MASADNRYKADLREMQFVLFEQFRIQEFLGKAPFEDWGPDECRLVLEETYRFVTEVTGPSTRSATAGLPRRGRARQDARGLRAKRGRSSTRPAGGSSRRRSASAGRERPTRCRCWSRRCSTAPTSPSTCTRVSPTAPPSVVAEFGTERQQKLYADQMFNGVWGGTMCLTEPQAGSDVGSATTSAKKNPDGTYRIRGTKIFICGGDHDLADNIVHLVLARIEGAPAGTRACRCSSCRKRPRERRRHPGRPERCASRLHRAQDRHQRLGDLRAAVRRRGRLHRRARRHRGASGHVARCST